MGKPLKKFGPIICLSESSGEAHLSWGNIAELIVRNGNEIIVEPVYKAQEQLLINFILGPALGILLYQRGFLVLHGSAVSKNGYAIAFLGYKGSGKSTIAAFLHSIGFSFITDDVLLIEIDKRISVRPGIPQIKLWPDAVENIGEDPETLPRICEQTDKRILKIKNSFLNKSLPLEKIYIIERGDRQIVESMKNTTAFIELIRHSYAQRFLINKISNPEHFKQCFFVTNTIPMYSLKTEIRAISELGISQLIYGQND